MHTSCRQGAARFLCEWHPDAIKPVHSDVLREMSSKRPEEGWVEARIEARIEEKSAVEAGIEKPPPNARSEEAVVEAGIEPASEARHDPPVETPVVETATAEASTVATAR